MKTIVLLLGLVSSLSSGTQKFESAGDEKSPRVRTFGYDYTYPTSSAEYESADIKASTRASFDLGVNYEAPAYTQAQYYITRQRASLFLGGRNELSMTFYPLRLNFYLDLWPAKLTFENYLDYDLLGSDAFCWATFRYWDVLRFLLYVQIDYADCAYGIGGYFLDNTAPDNGAGNSESEACQWQTYYVNKPLIDVNLSGEGTEEETSRSKGCKNRIIPRYDA